MGGMDRPARRKVIPHPAGKPADGRALFNAFNANTELVRVNNIGASNFNALTQNLSPRISGRGQYQPRPISSYR
jgi:hypothetical protein